MIKAAVFDLDGTLIDSLPDLADSINIMLHNNGFPERSDEHIISCIGTGAANLVAGALPDGIGKEHPDFDRYYNEYRAIYVENKFNKTAPYDGINEMLTELSARGVSICVLSNKPDSDTVLIAEKLFPDIRFAMVLGQREDIRRKPAPDGVFYIAEKLGVSLDEILYIGDSGTDMQTAGAAGVASVGVTWGYRDIDDLINNGACHIIGNPSELIKYIL